MGTRLKVLLHGDSLVLAGVHAGLADYAMLDVTLDPGAEVDLHALRNLAPDVIILEHSAAAAPSCTPPSFTALAAELPNVLLISIDVDRDQMLMWSGRFLHRLSMADFVRLIVHHVAHGTDGEGVAQNVATTHCDGVEL